MPEGDTILRSARVLARAIGGQRVRRFESTVPGVAGARLEGQRVEAVEAAGKYLLVRFEDGRVLRTHMRMTGSWHIYRPGERWRKSPGAARVVLEAGAWVAVCFAAPLVELERAAAGGARGAGVELGPDVLAEGFAPEVAVGRIAAEGARAIAEVLLDQRVLAGIGNVYKSELLFLARIAPLAPASQVPVERLRALVGDAVRLMRANLETPARATRGLERAPAGAAAARYWVYRRQGRPCLRCAAAEIELIRQGDARRSTYFCPRCQALGG